MSNETEKMRDEKKARSINGMFMLLLNIALMVGAIVLLVWGIQNFNAWWIPGVIPITIAACLYLFIVGPILFCGLKILKPNDALVLTLFGKYYGSLKGEGFYFVNPFVVAVNPLRTDDAGAWAEILTQSGKGKSGTSTGGQSKHTSRKKVISLKAMTLNNENQKINDELGNPIEIGIVVIWKVINTAKAVFNVDNFQEFLSIQCDSALRNIVRMYPYDVADDHEDHDDHKGEKSLRGSSQEVAEKLKAAIQEKVEVAGLEIIEARITHLAYAPEIAAAMLQRQQAAAIIDARKMIVEGAVSMVEMALTKLNEKDLVQLDEERKAAMVSNLLVVLCGNKDAQPIVNSGTIY